MERISKMERVMKMFTVVCGLGMAFMLGTATDLHGISKTEMRLEALCRYYSAAEALLDAICEDYPEEFGDVIMETDAYADYSDAKENLHKSW